VDPGERSYALTIILSCTLQENSRHELVHKLWLVSAQLAMQKLSSLSYCRAACHTMICLLIAGLVEYKEVDRAIDAAVLSSALNGPAVLCDSALELWLHMVSLEGQHRPGINANTGYQNMLEWIISKWGSSMSGEFVLCYTQLIVSKVITTIIAIMVQATHSSLMPRSSLLCAFCSVREMKLPSVLASLLWDVLAKSGSKCTTCMKHQTFFICCKTVPLSNGSVNCSRRLRLQG